MEPLNINAPSKHAAEPSITQESTVQLALALTDLIRELRPTDRRARVTFQRRMKRMLRRSPPERVFYRAILQEALRGL